VVGCNRCSASSRARLASSSWRRNSGISSCILNGKVCCQETSGYELVVGTLGNATHDQGGDAAPVHLFTCDY
jgi:hypothetical protein